MTEWFHRSFLQVKDREAVFVAELRHHKRVQQARLRGWLAKWGSEADSVLRGAAFCSWRDVLQKVELLRKYAPHLLSPFGPEDLELLTRTCLEAWRQVHGVGWARRERELQRARLASSVVRMVSSSQGRIVLQGSVVAWKDEAARGRVERREKDREAVFVAELRHHKRVQQARLQGWLAKWGSEADSVLRGAAFCSWRDVLQKVELLRKYATHLLSPLGPEDLELLTRTCLEAWRQVHGVGRARRERELQRARLASSVVRMVSSSQGRIVLQGSVVAWKEEAARGRVERRDTDPVCVVLGNIGFLHHRPSRHPWGVASPPIRGRIGRLQPGESVYEA